MRIGRNRTTSEKLRKLRCTARNKPTLENEEPQRGARNRKLELDVVKVKAAAVWGVCLCAYACKYTYLCTEAVYFKTGETKY